MLANPTTVSITPANKGAITGMNKDNPYTINKTPNTFLTGLIVPRFNIV